MPSKCRAPPNLRFFLRPCFSDKKKKFFPGVIDILNAVFFEVVSPSAFCLKSARNLPQIRHFLDLQCSKIPPLRNSLHKDSLIGFLCQDILLPNNKVCIPWYKETLLYSEQLSKWLRKHFFNVHRCVRIQWLSQY